MDEDLYTYITFILPCVLFGTPVQAHAFGVVIHVQQKRKPRIEKDGKAFVKGVQGSTRVWSGICLASYPGRMGGEKRPGIMAGHLFQYYMAVFDTFDKTFDKSFDAFEKLFDVNHLTRSINYLHLINYLMHSIRGHFQTIFFKINVNMTLRGSVGQGRDANFNMNFEPSFLIVGLVLCQCK